MTVAARLESIARRPPIFILRRAKSSSPYGRSHVLRRRTPSLPAPCVPEFPQLVVRADGSTFTHWTTSPRGVLRLTRDVTNSPAWNSSMWIEDDGAGTEREDGASGRLGRFRRRFEDSAGMDYDGVTEVSIGIQRPKRNKKDVEKAKK